MKKYDDLCGDELEWTDEPESITPRETNYEKSTPKSKKVRKNSKSEITDL